MPVRHIILGWHKDEQPSIEKQHACADALLKRLGVDSHQSIRVVHTEDKTTARASGNGRHYEMHIALNGVSPTGKAPESTRDWATIEIATAWVAAEHGFAEIPGRFNGIGDGPKSSRNGKARSVSAQKEKPTIADELSADPERLQRLKNARAWGMQAGSWNPLLEELDRQGLRLERGKDRGSQRVRGLILVDQADPKRRHKFSALDTPVLKWGEGPLTIDLGPLPADLSIPVATAHTVADEPTVNAKPKPSADAAKPSNLDREIERRMRHERSVLRGRFNEEQDRIHHERSRILTVKKRAWPKFQGRRAELLDAARTRRNLLYWIFPKRKLLRKLLNTRFDRTLNAKLQAARGVFDAEKALPLPNLQCWTTWSADRLRAARNRIQQELIDEFAAKATAARKKAEEVDDNKRAVNRDMILRAWGTSSDQVVIRWNSRARPAETVASLRLVSELRTAGIVLEGELGGETVQLSVGSLVDWIGIGHDRDKRLAVIEQAALSSRREADAIVADQSRKTAEREQQRQLADTEEIIKTFWSADSTQTHVTLRWNSPTGPGATVAAKRLADTLAAAGVAVLKAYDGSWGSVSISDLARWIGTEEERDQRLRQTRLAARESIIEMAALERDQHAPKQSGKAIDKAEAGTRAGQGAETTVAEAAKQEADPSVQPVVPSIQRPFFNRLSDIVGKLDPIVGQDSARRETGQLVPDVIQPQRAAAPAQANQEPALAASKADSAAAAPANSPFVKAPSAEENSSQDASRWAARWVSAAPKSNRNRGRLVWLLPPRTMPPDEPLRRLVENINEHPELEPSSRLLEGGYREVSVSAAAMTELLTTVAPSDRSICDDAGASCHSASRANYAEQRAFFVEANAWTESWIKRAPRSVLALDRLTWRWPEHPSQSDPVATLWDMLLKAYSSLDAMLSDGQLSVAEEFLRPVLTTVDPQQRGRWDQVARQCAIADQADWVDLDRQLEQVLRSEERPHKSDQGKLTPSVTRGDNVDQAVDAVEPATDPSPAEPGISPESPTPQTGPSWLQRLRAALDSRVEPSSSRWSDPEPVRISKSSPSVLPALNAEVEQPVGTALAAELLGNHQQYRLVRYDRRSRTVWMITRDEIWNGTASPSSDGAHGLGPALANLGLSWRSAAYSRHPDLIVYEMQFSELAQALGRLPKTAFEGWCDRLRRATFSSDAQRRDTEHAAKIGEPRQANSAEKLNKQGGRGPESGGGINM